MSREIVVAFQFLNHKILGSNVNSVVDGKVFQVHLKPFLKVMPAEKEKPGKRAAIARSIKARYCVYSRLGGTFGDSWDLPQATFFLQIMTKIASKTVLFKKFLDKVEKILKGSLDSIPSPSRSCEHLNFLFLFFFRQNIAGRCQQTS